MIGAFPRLFTRIHKITFQSPRIHLVTPRSISTANVIHPRIAISRVADIHPESPKNTATTRNTRHDTKKHTRQGMDMEDRAMSDEIIKALQALARSTEERPVSARLRDYIAEIDTAIAAGVKPETIEKALASFGIVLSPSALRGALYRFRKKRKAEGGATGRVIAVPENRPENNPPLLQGATEFSSVIPATTVNDPKPGAYKSDLTQEEKEVLKGLTPTEKIEFFRQREAQMKFTHNPTPERFRKLGE